MESPNNVIKTHTISYSASMVRALPIDCFTYRLLYLSMFYLSIADKAKILLLCVFIDILNFFRKRSNHVQNG